MLGTTEPIEDGFFVHRPQELKATDALDLVPDVLAPVVLAGVAVVAGARFVGRRLRRDDQPTPSPTPDDTPPPLPSAPLAVALCGHEFLVGRRGRVLRRVPEEELLATLRRPKLSAELTIDGQEFVAAGVEGDIALRLQRTRRGRARPDDAQA